MEKHYGYFGVYGASMAGRIVYYQKMGVAKGAIESLKQAIAEHGINPNDESFKRHYTVGNNKISETIVYVELPKRNWLEHECPIFHSYGDSGVIDKLRFDDELQFHLVGTKGENLGWRTVREGFDLQNTCVLYEYIQDVSDELVFYGPVNED